MNKTFSEPIPYGTPAQALSSRAMSVGYSPEYGEGAKERTLAKMEYLLKQLDGLILKTFAYSQTHTSFDGDSDSSMEQRAVVWDPKEQKAKMLVLLTWGSRYGIDKDMFSPFTANATPETAAAYAAWYKGTYLPEVAKAHAERTALQQGTKANDALYRLTSEIHRGDTVVVVKGRKFARGLVGRTFWSGQDNFGNMKFGVALSDRKDPSGKNSDVMWIAASNVEKVLTGTAADEAQALRAKIAEYATQAYKDSLAAQFTTEYAEPLSMTDAMPWAQLTFNLPM